MQSTIDRPKRAQKLNAHCFPRARDRAIENGSVAAVRDELAVGDVLSELMVDPALHWVRPQHVVAAGM